MFRTPNDIFFIVITSVSASVSASISDIMLLLQLCCPYLFKLTIYVIPCPEIFHNPISRIKTKRNEEEGTSTTNIQKAKKNHIVDGETPEKPRLIIYGVPKFWSTKTTTKWVQTIGCPKGKIRKGQGQNFAIIAFQDEVCMSIFQSLLAWLLNTAAYIFFDTNVMLNQSYTNCFEIYGE